MCERGIVFDIQKFSIHDGPGIRTTVFLKGCPLRCLWCHNPESHKREPEISFTADRCIHCGWCFENCPQSAHVQQEHRHVLLRDRCIRCGICAQKCFARAIEVIGREMTVTEVMTEVIKDLAFYQTSGGGLTLSGGEPMMQYPFTAALLRAAKAAGLHTCLDTCGFAPPEQYLSLLHDVDLFLYDIKDTQAARHLQLTGAPLAPILDNLKKIDAAGGQIILRCPLIPGINTDLEHLHNLAELANSLDHIVAVTLHPYHPLGQSKAEHIGASWPLPENSFAGQADIADWLREISSRTSKPVRQN
jgi:pyruvate formate lyase activating enzyme